MILRALALPIDAAHYLVGSVVVMGHLVAYGAFARRGDRGHGRSAA